MSEELLILIKWIRYHFLHLNDKKWKLTSLSLILVVLMMFLYFGGLLDGSIERILFKERYLFDYELETFTLLNVLIIIWVLMGTKEIYLLDEPHILLINKSKYLISKAVAYLLFYFIIFSLMYFLYQIVLVSLYGFMRFNYYFLIHLLLNIFLVHSVVLLISGKTRSILKMILLIIILFSLDQLKGLKLEYFKNISLFYPSLSQRRPNEGYLHIILISLFYYLLALFRHELSLT